MNFQEPPTNFGRSFSGNTLQILHVYKNHRGHHLTFGGLGPLMIIHHWFRQWLGATMATWEIWIKMQNFSSRNMHLGWVMEMRLPCYLVLISTWNQATRQLNLCDPTTHLLIVMSPKWQPFCPGQNMRRVRGAFQNTYELLNLRALKFSHMKKIHIFQCMCQIFCVEFQRYPLKFHTKYLTHTLKDMIFIQRWNFKSS